MAQQLIISEHEDITYRHDFSKNLLWLFCDAYVISKALAHFLYPIKTLKEGHENERLRFLSIFPLKFPADYEIKLLVCSTKLYISFKYNRIITLYQGIQKLMNTYGILVCPSLFKVIPFEHPRNRIFARKTYHIIC